MTRRRSALAILFVIVFVDLLGFGMVIPVMALYAERLGATDAQTGWLMTGYSAMQFLFTPVWGRLSDRFGRRPLLLGSIAMTALGFLAYALAPDFGWLLGSRLFAGAATANIAIAQAYIADVTTPEGRARGMGIIGAAFGLGFVLGPFLGGVLSGWSLAAPGFAAAGLAAVNGVAALVLLPEPEERSERPRRARLQALWEELSRPGIRRLIAIFFLAVLAFSAMEATFALLAAHRYGLVQRQVGWVFAFIGVLVTVVQGGLIGPLSRRYGEVPLLVAGLFLQALGLAMLPYGGGTPGLYGACVPLAIGSGLANPTLSALLSRRARAEDQGGTLGMGQSAAALGRIAGPISATNAYGHVWFAAPYLGGAALLLVTAAVGLTLRSPIPGAGSQEARPAQ
ncbi:MAG TPA: MFS transporter [Anaeromyxobacter sp.]|nr:MFS transporter [Anaeromyxobacter sp.]